MKASEFRIGNFVYTTIDMCLYTIDPFIIKCLYYDGNVQNSHNTHEKLIEPIPLTEEWLLKFGFKEVIYHDGITYYDKDILSIDIFSDCYINDEKIEVKHVHQLQNLYFALTGEELTIKQ